MKLRHALPFFAFIALLLTILLLPAVIMKSTADERGLARSPRKASTLNVPDAINNDTCEGAIPLSLQRAVNGDLTTFTDNYELSDTSTCFVGIGQQPSTMTGPDAVYSFTAPVAGNYSIKLSDYTGTGDLGLLLPHLVAAPVELLLKDLLGADQRERTAL